MQTGDKSGDGRVSPFGGGNGGKGIGGNMSGNNFITNPGGTPSGPRTLPDMVNNSRPQPKAKPDINTQDAAPGGVLPAAAPPNTRPGGVGTVGNSAKPFRLGGG
jgi:hypothetical protein